MEGMTQEQAIKTAERFLTHIYASDNTILSRILSASADGNKEYISYCLDVVIAYCNELKKAMN